MPQVEIGMLSFAPKGYALAKNEEKFEGNTRTFSVVNLHGGIVPHWASAVSTKDARETFLRWFKKNYPYVNPPFRGNIVVFRKNKTLPI